MNKKGTLSALRATARRLKERADGGRLPQPMYPSIHDIRGETERQTKDRQRAERERPTHTPRDQWGSRLSDTAGYRDMEQLDDWHGKDELSRYIHKGMGFADGGAPFFEGLPETPPAEPFQEGAPNAERAPVSNATIAGVASGFLPGSGVADVMGQFPNFEGGKQPSFGANIREGNYGTAGLQALGAAGDALYAIPAVGPVLGAAAKLPRAIQAAKAARELSPLGFYSHASEAAASLPQAKGSPQQMKAMLEKAGVKPEELKWSGFDDWAASRPTVTRDELVAHFNEKQPQVNEVRLQDTGQKAPRERRWEELNAEERSDVLRQFEDMMDGPENLAREYPTRRERIDAARNWHNEQAVILEQDAIPKGAPKHGRYALPGGENYREVLLTLPDGRLKRKRELEVKLNSGNASLAERQEYDNLIDSGVRDSRGFISNHWDEPNVLAHMRLSDRTISEPGWAWQNKTSGNTTKTFSTKEDAEAHLDTLPEHLRPNLKLVEKPHQQKVLHLEELQSDWAQKGRKEGFKDPAKPFTDAQREELHNLRLKRDQIENKYEEGGFNPPPDVAASYSRMNARIGELEAARKAAAASGLPAAPFVTNTSAWVDLGLKRALREAAEKGYDRLVWTPGEAQAARYDLSKQVDSIAVLKRDDGTYIVKAMPKGGGTNIDLGSNVPSEKLGEIVGKELAEKIVKTAKTKETKIYQGLDLKVGGEGMKSFYDKIVPTQLGKLAKKLDPEAKIETVGVPGVGKDVSSTIAMDALGIPRRSQDEYWRNLSPYKRQDLLKEHKAKYDNMPMQSIRITPKMREAIMGGLPLYSTGGFVLTPVDDNPFIERKSGGKVNVSAINHAPTEAQKEAGNYAKDHVRMHGLDITIENAKGSERFGTGKDGKRWSVTMPCHYGYIKGTVGKDKDHIDINLGPHPKSPRAFVIDQVDDNGRFDEHKTFLGFANRNQVVNTYKRSFSDGKGAQRLGAITEVSVPDFKEWLASGDHKKPMRLKA